MSKRRESGINLFRSQLFDSNSARFWYYSLISKTTLAYNVTIPELIRNNHLEKKFVKIEKKKCIHLIIIIINRSRYSRHSNNVARNKSNWTVVMHAHLSIDVRLINYLILQVGEEERREKKSRENSWRVWLNT